MSEIQPIFYYDIGDPEAYLAAEQVLKVLPVVPEWQPVLAKNLSDEASEKLVNIDRLALEVRAEELELQSIRWPEKWPPDSEFAMLVATYAKQIGRAVAFSLAAFRQVFAGGRDLADPDTVLIAAAACEMHPNAVLRNAERASIKTELLETTKQAKSLGILDVPTLQIGKELYVGQKRLQLLGLL